VSVCVKVAKNQFRDFKLEKKFVRTEKKDFPASEQDPKRWGEEIPNAGIYSHICVYDLQEKKTLLLGSDVGRYLIR